MTAQNFKRHLQPISSAWRPLALLPVTVSQQVQLNDLPKVVPLVDNGAKFEHRVSRLNFILSPLYHASPLDFMLASQMSHFQGYCMRLLYREHGLCAQSVSSDSFCHPLDCSLQGSSVHRIFQARVLEWVAISFSRGSSWLRDQTRVSCIAGRHFAI